jgi:hypothetical protein
MAGKSPDWFAVRAEYVAGSMSLRALAEKHGLSHDTLRRQSRTGKWTEARREQARKVAAELEARTVASRVVQLKEWNDADLTLAKNVRARIAMRLAKIGPPADHGDQDLKALQTITTMLESVQRIARLALGATTHNSGVSGPNGGPLEVAAAVPSMDDFYETLQAVEIVEH